MIEAAFFDLDGTLLDTIPDICVNLNAALERFGYPPLSEEQTGRCVGSGARRLVELAIPSASDLDEVYAYFRAHYSERNAHARHYFGMSELLAAWKAKGVKLAVITNKPQEASERVMAQFFPEGTFDYIGGDSGSFPLKPDPAHLRYAALKLRVSLKNCLFIGDGEADIQVAKNAGMRSVSVLWGYRTREQLLSAGATQFVLSPAELEKMAENFGENR